MLSLKMNINKYELMTSYVRVEKLHRLQISHRAKSVMLKVKLILQLKFSDTLAHFL
jgi:hypothetical protein